MLAEMKSHHRNIRRTQDLHFFNDEGMIACSPRDREAAHRVQVEGIATQNPNAVTCDFTERVPDLRVKRIKGPHFILQAKPEACLETIQNFASLLASDSSK